MATEEHEKAHEHVLPDGTIIAHAHQHTQTKKVLHRMDCIIGHLRGIRKMIEAGQDCSDVLVQLSAVHSAVRAIEKIVLKDHIEHCIVDEIQNGDMEAVHKLNKAIDKFIR